MPIALLSKYIENQISGCKISPVPEIMRFFLFLFFSTIYIIKNKIQKIPGKQLRPFYITVLIVYRSHNFLILFGL